MIISTVRALVSLYHVAFKMYPRVAAFDLVLLLLKLCKTLEDSLRSLSNDFFERRTLTGSGLFELSGRDFEQILGQIVCIKVKTLKPDLAHKHKDKHKHMCKQVKTGSTCA